MKFVETPLLVPLQGETLVGLLATPGGPAADTALLVVVGGPQVRAGSHRLFVMVARTLAAQGYPVLRCDVRGMGDSSGTPAGFEHQHDDIAAAVTALLAQCPGVRRVVLWGLCDGASAALLYLQRTADPRIAGVALLNPWVRSPQTLARATLRHYYLQRMRQPGFWRKLLIGSVGPAAVRGWWRNYRTARQRLGLAAAAPFAERMAQGWRACAGPLLLVLSGDDVTAQEFAEHAAGHPAWQGTLGEARLTRVDLPDADHTFSSTTLSQQLTDVTLDWLRLHFAPAGAAPRP
jgi:exosortase A-associated hydrolase 1